ncbi:ionotropic receptor 21a [Schistocerca americana]|uniref:ionotropic receptor 21a n=1 Tax=Schistocerca americana TaxID=7009 RepID=UPI001F4F1F93|nr:ionotropic receptor 21a [Schistocerca americana]
MGYIETSNPTQDAVPLGRRSAVDVGSDAHSGLLVTDASQADVDAFLDTKAGLWLVIPLESPAEFYVTAGRRRPLQARALRAAVAHAPPFVFKSQDKWTGVEVLLLQTMAQALRVPLEFVDVSGRSGSPGDAVVSAVSAGEAHVGAAGVYQTPERLRAAAFTTPHSVDCAVFLSLATAALPRYRAILGPFDWSVWLALTVVYLLAIFPLAFSNTHSLRHLLEDPWELENMFWYVFGTFTNAFTFTGRRCWSNSTKNATRMLIGWYWVFSIIITACYTGSIIAFVTLPVYPSLLNTCQQAADWGFTVGTLAEGGWERWFHNSSDAAMNRVLERVELLPDVHAALLNITSSWRRSYAFLGPRALLDFIIRTNYSVRSAPKRSLLHVGEDCVVPFSVSLALPRSAPYAPALVQLLLRAQQSGLVALAARDVEWQHVRSSSGRLLAAVTGAILKSRRDAEHKLSLDDVQGTFLLLGAGFAMGVFALVLEGLHACCHRLLDRHASTRRPRPRCPTVTVTSPQPARSLSAADASPYLASRRRAPELQRPGHPLRIAMGSRSAYPDLCRPRSTSSQSSVDQVPRSGL